jgi:excisionase family DNA binding protein
MAASDDLLTVEEAALRSRYSVKTIYRAIRRGDLSASKPASRYRIRPADLDRWLAAGLSVESLTTRPAELPAPVMPSEVGSLERLRAMESDAA